MKGAKWTNADIKQLDSMVKAMKSNKEISEATGRTIGAVAVKKNILNMTTYMAQFKHDQMKRLHDVGDVDKVISEKVGLSQDVICYWRKKNGLEANQKKVNMASDPFFTKKRRGMLVRFAKSYQHYSEFGNRQGIEANMDNFINHWHKYGGVE